MERRFLKPSLWLNHPLSVGEALIYLFSIFLRIYVPRGKKRKPSCHHIAKEQKLCKCRKLSKLYKPSLLCYPSIVGKPIRHRSNWKCGQGPSMISHMPICQFQSRQTHWYLETGWKSLMSKYHALAFSVETDMHRLVCNIYEWLLALPLWCGRLCHAGWIATLPPPTQNKESSEGFPIPHPQGRGGRREFNINQVWNFAPGHEVCLELINYI